MRAARILTSMALVLGACSGGDEVAPGADAGTSGPPPVIVTDAGSALDAGVSDASTQGPGDTDYPDLSGCPNGDGLTCGWALGLGATELYDCRNGTASHVKSCGARCLQGSDGLPDGCPCPGGDGPRCGARLGLDANAVYACDGLKVDLLQICAGGCTEGATDACTACPAGDGAYCGAALGLDPGTLFDCRAGVVTPLQTCAGDCTQGEPDHCAGCPSGDGRYCGGAFGLSAEVLYDCAGGVLTAVQSCATGCEVRPPGQPDACASRTCPAGDGLYCGSAVGRDAKTLFQCTGGVFTPSEACPSGCEVRPSGTNDRCRSGACPSGDGLYCGPTLGRDANTLFRCTGGALSIVSECGAGCEVMPSGTNDRCKASTCPSGNGLYCGATLGRDSNTLYDCQAGVVSVKLACTGGCEVMPAGTNDRCRAATCPSGNGLYCGATLGRDANTLYDCRDGAITAKEACAAGCRIAHAGQADSCAPLGCPSGDGLYCGITFGRSANELLRCTGGRLAVAETCANGCRVAAAGQADSCAPAACPSGNGLYCGASVGSDARTLYRCAGGSLSIERQCAGACRVNPPGQSDACAAAACPSGDGLYCGASVGADAGVLYQCASGQLTVAQRCASGCDTHAAGVPDACASTCSASSRSALAWEARELAAGNSWSNYCLGFVNQAFRNGPGLVVPELQLASAADTLDRFRSNGRLHSWSGTAPCGALVFWDRSTCNGNDGHIAISNGDGTVSTSGWPGFGGSAHAAIVWLSAMECGQSPAGWVDAP